MRESTSRALAFPLLMMIFAWRGDYLRPPDRTAPESERIEDLSGGSAESPVVLKHAPGTRCDEMPLFLPVFFLFIHKRPNFIFGSRSKEELSFEDCRTHILEWRSLVPKIRPFNRERMGLLILAQVHNRIEHICGGNAVTACIHVSPPDGPSSMEEAAEPRDALSCLSRGGWVEKGSIKLLPRKRIHNKHVRCLRACIHGKFLCVRPKLLQRIREPVRMSCEPSA